VWRRKVEEEAGDAFKPYFQVELVDVAEPGETEMCRGIAAVSGRVAGPGPVMTSG